MTPRVEALIRDNTGNWLVLDEPRQDVGIVRADHEVPPTARIPGATCWAVAQRGLDRRVSDSGRVKCAGRTASEFRVRLHAADDDEVSEYLEVRRVSCDEGKLF